MRDKLGSELTLTAGTRMKSMTVTRQNSETYDPRITFCCERLANPNTCPARCRCHCRSANKIISGVVDSSFGVLRSFLPSALTSTSAPDPSDARWNMGLLRRESGILIASLVPEREKPEEKGQGQSELVEVSSRPDKYVQFM